MTKAQIRAAATDAEIIALTLWGEHRSGPVTGRIAVACVIRRRVHVGGFGAGWKGVCLRRWQFSCWLPEGGASNHRALLRMATAVLSGQRGDAVYRECLWIAKGIIDGAAQDIVRRADHYYAPLAMVPVGRVPRWARGKSPVATVEGHLFFRLRAAS